MNMTPVSMLSHVSQKHIQWTVPQLSIIDHLQLLQYMVNFNPIDSGYIVRWQAYLLSTKEAVLHVCDKSYHTNNGI